MSQRLRSGFTLFSLREYIVSPKGKHRFLSEKRQKTIGSNHVGEHLCYHLPRIYHRTETPLNTGVSGVCGSVVDKNTKIKIQMKPNNKTVTEPRGWVTVSLNNFKNNFFLFLVHILPIHHEPKSTINSLN